MRLISWNLNGRRRDATAQAEALLARAPDAVALQEITVSSLPYLRAALAAGGLAQIADSFSLASPDFQPRGPRRYGQLTASRYSLTPEAPARFPVPWPERVLTVRLEIGDRSAHLHNAHIPPGSSNGWTKIDMLNFVYSVLAVQSDHPESSAATSTHPNRRRRKVRW